MLSSCGGSDRAWRRARGAGASGDHFTHVPIPWWEALAAARALRLRLEAQSPRKRAAWAPPLPLAADFSSNLPCCCAPTPRTWHVWAWPSGSGTALSLRHAKFSTNSKNPSANKGEHRACCSLFMRQFPLAHWHTSSFPVPFRDVYKHVCSRELGAPSRFCWTIPAGLALPGDPLDLLTPGWGSAQAKEIKEKSMRI